jgi:type II secretory pathway component PulF
MSHGLAQALAADPDSAVAILQAAGHGAAATELQAGRGLAQILADGKLVAPAYVSAFEAGAPQAVRPLVEAAERFENRRLRVRQTARAALISAGLAWVVMIGANEWVLPAFFQQFVQCSGTLPGALKLGIEVFGHLGSTGGLVLTALVFAGLWFGMDRVWRRTPAGRRSVRAHRLRSLATLVSAGVEVPIALRRVGGASAYAAAHAIDAGRPVGQALRRTGWIPERHVDLLNASGSGLGAVLAALATAAEADEAAGELQIGRWIWATYALVIGGLATLFACLIMVGSVTVLQCLG